MTDLVSVMDLCPCTHRMEDPMMNSKEGQEGIGDVGEIEMAVVGIEGIVEGAEVGIEASHLIDRGIRGGKDVEGVVLDLLALRKMTGGAVHRRDGVELELEFIFYLLEIRKLLGSNREEGDSKGIRTTI